MKIGDSHFVVSDVENKEQYRSAAMRNVATGQSNESKERGFGVSKTKILQRSVEPTACKGAKMPGCSNLRLTNVAMLKRPLAWVDVCIRQQNVFKNCGIMGKRFTVSP